MSNSKELDTDGSKSFELSCRQAALAYERTLMSIDQALLGMIRSSLSLVGFGFAMALFFSEASPRIGVDLNVPARNFGLSLVAFGIVLTIIGLYEHRLRFSYIRREVDELYSRGLLLNPFSHKRTPIAVVAHLFFFMALLVMLGMGVRMGLF